MILILTLFPLLSPLLIELAIYREYNESGRYKGGCYVDKNY